jgi:hypothetical protein
VPDGATVQRVIVMPSEALPAGETGGARVERRGDMAWVEIL